MRFSLPQFSAYEGASGDFPVSKGPPTVPLTQILCNAVFFKSQNANKAGTLCITKAILGFLDHNS